MAEESWVLDGFALHNRPAGLKMRAANVPVAAKRPTWLESPDADGQALLEDPRHGNRVLTFTLAYDRLASRDAALAALGELVDKLEACGRTAGGLDLVWTPQDGSKSMTLHALLGEISDLPIEVGGQNSGWFRNGPVVVVTITCAPFGELPSVAGTPTTATAYAVERTIDDVAGDAPALGTVRVTDEETAPLRWIEWGAGTDTTSPIILAAADLNVSGFAGSLATGAQPTPDGGFVRGKAATTPTAICGTGAQPHVGEWRVICKARHTNQGYHVRLSWRAGDGSYSPNAWTTIPAAAQEADVNWGRADLGLVSIPAGLGQWDGRIEAYSDDAARDFDVGGIILIPTSLGYGYARAFRSAAAPTNVVADGFSSGTDSATLDSGTADVGGTWALDGDLTNSWVYNDDAFNGRVVSCLSASGHRYAVIGSGLSNVRLTATIYPSFYSGEGGFIARWIDTDNYVRLTVTQASNDPSSGYTTTYLALVKRVGGTETTIATTTIVTTTHNSNIYHALLTVEIDDGGRVTASLTDIIDTTSLPIPDGSLVAQDPDLASGGMLESGACGIASIDAVANNIEIADFAAGIPAASNPACYPSQSFEITSIGPRRESSDGTAWGAPGDYTGSDCFIPPAGAGDVSSRVVVVAETADLLTEPWLDAAEKTLQVDHTPRVKVVPR
jgi:hypothetical protein